MRNTRKFTPDLAAAIHSVGEHQAQALTLAELIRAYDAQACTAELVRLRKWTEAFGGRSAWEVQSEQLSAVAQALVDAGYKPSSPNRDLSALGMVYRWAIERQSTILKDLWAIVSPDIQSERCIRALVLIRHLFSIPPLKDSRLPADRWPQETVGPLCP
jgi:site-specific recombinase XerD